jgi:hypothetical protein
LVCNGVETCDETLGCQSGTSLLVDDGIDCTVDTCAEPGIVVSTPDESLCTSGWICSSSSGCYLP